MDKNNKYEASSKDCNLFSVGNLANNVIFMFVGTYIMYYYTNVLGIGAKVAGTIFLVARLIDAFTDPLMGMIVDRTNTKFGKYRPYITFGAPFLGIIFVVLFTSPGFSVGGKIAYAYITYILYSLAWTVVQIPQLALPIILSNDVARRTKIQTVFQAFGAIGSMVVTSWALPMLNYFGGMDNPAAWKVVTAIFAVVTTIIFILSAMSVRKLDVYNPSKKAISGKPTEKVSLKKTLSVILSNRALLCVLFAYGTDMFANQISTSFRLYFFKYNMDGRTDLITTLGYVSTAVSFAMILFIEGIAKKMGKRSGILIIEAIAILPSLLLLYAAPHKNVTLVMTSYIVSLFLFAITNTLSRSAVSDAANYAQIKTGVNGNALVSSTFTFVNKIAQAFSMYFSGSILASTGYNASLKQQGPGTLNAILYMITLIPIIAFVCSLIGMYFYPLKRKDEIEMQDKMREIRAAELAASATIAIDSDSLNIP